jgi:hypothetical protein
MWTLISNEDDYGYYGANAMVTTVMVDKRQGKGH